MFNGILFVVDKQWMVNNYCLLYTHSYKQQSKTHAWWQLDWWAPGLMQWLQLSSVKLAQVLLFSPLQPQYLKYLIFSVFFRRKSKLIFTSCWIWCTEMAKINRTLNKSDDMDQFYSTLFLIISKWLDFFFFFVKEHDCVTLIIKWL